MKIAEERIAFFYSCEELEKDVKERDISVAMDAR